MTLIVAGDESNTWVPNVKPSTKTLQLINSPDAKPIEPLEIILISWSGKKKRIFTFPVKKKNNK